MTIPAASQDLYGKTVGDMLGDDVEVLSDGTVTGTLKYVTGYTGFNESEASEQEGNFFPFKLIKSGKKMTFKKNGTVTKDNIAWEADNVFRVSKSDKFEVLVDGKSVITFDFSKATLQGKA